jgi:23S rRNA (cytidine1920-2'-O)/16S rRNA (cytidine1409-2'-O)-methyltransferase
MTRMAKRLRLDAVLTEKGLFPSREQAQRAIMAGEIRVNDRIATKSSLLVAPTVAIEVESALRYVSRGGLKLAGALDHFRIDVNGKVAMDIGASTGGFTDCLLQRGATKVFAIDVGYGQIAWKLRNDARVIVYEKLNARFLSQADIPEPVQVCVIDVSFISLTLILPNAIDLITANGVILALIKPQFELQRADVGRGGIVRDPAMHEKATQKIVTFAGNDARLRVEGVVSSDVRGMDGNQEFFICLRKQSA